MQAIHIDVIIICSFFIPVYDTFDDLTDAVKTKKVEGMLLDRYTAFHYQKRDKMKSLITIKMLELSRDVGIIFVKDYHKLVECLNFHRSAIWKSVQTITSNFKVCFVII